MILTLLLLAMTAVAIAGINADSIWYDEYFSLYYAGAMAEGSSTPMDVADRIIARESGQAPLYFVLLSFWSQAAGFHVFTARMLSLLIGALAVAWTYRLGADMHSSIAGFCAATIMVASALFNYYLHEIRMYTLVALAVSIVLWLYLRVVNGKGSLWSSAAFALVVAGALYTHAFMTVLILALGLFHLTLAARTRSWTRLLFLFAIAGVLFFPWALVIISKIGSKTAPSDMDFLRSNGELLIDLARGASNGYWVFLLLPLLSIKLARAHRGVRMLWWLGIAFVAALLAVNHNSRAINQLRYFLHIMPIFALLGGIACAQLIRYRKALALILAAFCLSGLVAVPSFGDILHIPGEVIVFHLGYPYKEITEIVKRAGGENDAVAFEFAHHSWAQQGVLNYYMRDAEARYVLTDLLGRARKPEEKRRLFGDFLGGAGRVYFVVDRTVTPSDFLPEYERILSERYVHCGSLLDDEWASINSYARNGLLCAPPANPLITFDQGAALLDFVHERNDEGFTFYSVWSAPLPADSYSFSLRFWDAEGNLVHQVDDALPLGEFSYRIDEAPSAILPDNESLRIEGVIYQWQSGERLRTLDGADVFPLGTIEAG
jgi:hypothetical protein